MGILAAAGEKRSPQRDIETGFGLATAFEDQLRVFHVIPENDADAHLAERRNIPGFHDYSIASERDRARDIALKLIDMTLEDYDWKVVSPVRAVGDPADAISRLADSMDPRSLVIGCRKRSLAGKAVVRECYAIDCSQF